MADSQNKLLNKFKIKGIDYDYSKNLNQDEIEKILIYSSLLLSSLKNIINDNDIKKIKITNSDLDFKLTLNLDKLNLTKEIFKKYFDV